MSFLCSLIRIFDVVEDTVARKNKQNGFDTTKSNAANLVIEKNGSGYKVSIQDMTVVLTISKKEVKGSVAYTGSIVSEK
ncbi:MAG: hypothetical protein IKZ48_03320 [Prevotella sp.]|nr:hypothetical protein [Prevotella sp.]